MGIIIERIVDKKVDEKKNSFSIMKITRVMESIKLKVNLVKREAKIQSFSISKYQKIKKIIRKIIQKKDKRIKRKLRKLNPRLEKIENSFIQKEKNK